MIRRTKDSILEGSPVVNLPPLKVHVEIVILDPPERALYNEVAIRLRDRVKAQIREAEDRREEREREKRSASGMSSDTSSHLAPGTVYKDNSTIFQELMNCRLVPLDMLLYVQERTSWDEEEFDQEAEGHDRRVSNKQKVDRFLTR